MTNSKTTKRALLTSVMALVLCFAMLTGTTFAWFTDTETSSGNKIVAGNLDVDLLMYTADQNTADGYSSIAKLTQPIFGVGSIAQDNNAETLWEPGKTQVAYLAIRNIGNLALKYNVIVDVTDNGLIGALEYAIVPVQGGTDAATTLEQSTWAEIEAAYEHGYLAAGKTIAAPNGCLDEIRGGVKDETDYFALVIHMDENAGNEYKSNDAEKNVVIDITVNATQVEAEADAFNSEYDKDALFAVADDLYVDNTTGAYVATSTAGLSSIAALASEDSSITSVVYVNEAGEEKEVPVISEEADFTNAIKEEEIVVLTAGNYTMPDGSDVILQGKTLTTVGTKDTVIDASGVDERDQFITGAEVVFEGITINFGTALYMGFANTTSLTYKDCTINGLQFLYGPEVTFENCVFNSNGAEHSVWTYGAQNVSFTNCSFTYGDRAINVYGVGRSSVTLDFNKCTFATTNTASKGAVEINSSAFPQGANVSFVDCTAPAYGTMVGISGWDSANGANATVTVDGDTTTLSQWAQ